MYLSIDYGTKVIGLAAGEIIPKGLGTLENNDKTIEHIAILCQEHDIGMIIIGMPIRNAGEEGTISPKIRDFAQRLANKTKIPVYFEPEQFTSVEATRIIQETGEKIEKEKIDELSAILILEQFIQRTVNEENLTPHIFPSEK